jgi:hypothetical protein
VIYLAVYGTLIFGGALSSSDALLRRILFAVFAIFLFAFVAFRYEVGCDWSGYANHFEQTRYWDEADALLGTEPGYWLLLVQLHRAGLDYPYLNLFMAIPFFWGLVALAWRQPDPLAFLILSFPVLILNMPMSAMRQATAIGFVCLALVAFQDRKLVRYTAMIIAGALFHTSAIVFLALAPFVRLTLTQATAVMAAVLVLPGMFFMFGEAAGFYADRYIGTNIDAAGAPYRVAMLALVGAYFLLVLRHDFRERFPLDYQLVLIGVSIMLGTLAILPLSSVMSDRFGYYVTPIQLMILARLPYLMRPGTQEQLMGIVPYVGLGVVLVVWTTNSSLVQQCYLPYQTWLSWRY